MTAGRLLSVNVGGVRDVPTPSRRTVPTGIWKAPVAGRVAVRGVNLEGDDQADRRVHGGPHKAVYAYAREELDWWEREVERPLEHGAFGENLTTEGLDVSGALLGERWHVGTTVLEVVQPRVPCFKLGLRFDDPRMVRAFAKAHRPGAYLRIVEEGALQAGDAIDVVDVPDHGVTVRFVFQALLGDHERFERALDAPQLPVELRDWMRQGLTS